MSSINVVDYSEEEIKKAHDVLYNEGLRMRIKVAGQEYVEKSLKAATDPFAKPMQEFVAEACWGWVWARPGLELKTRSFLNIAMLCQANRSTELATHVKGALNNGGTEEEIREVILQAATYCGMPVGIEGFRVASKAIQEYRADQERKGHHVDRHTDLDLGTRAKTDSQHSEIDTGAAPKDLSADAGHAKKDHQVNRHQDLDLGTRMNTDDL